MNYSNKKYILGGITTMSLFVSCVTKKYTDPVLNTDKLYRDVSVSDTLSIADLSPKELFSDTVLVMMIEIGLKENLDLKIAVERINEAQALFKQSKATFLPQLSGGLNVNQSKQSPASLNFPPEYSNSINLKTTSYQAALNTSWEADVWGKLSSSKRAALANLLKSDAAKRAIQTQLIANIANNYYNLLALDEQLAITKKTLEIRISDVKTIKSLKDAAVVNGAAEVQSEANKYAVEVTIPDLNQSIRETENMISILLAKSPTEIKRSQLKNQQPLANLKVGIPSQLLKNRPDIQQAEYNFKSAFENTNLAKTYFYPQLTLTGQAGLSSLKLKNLFESSIFYNFIGGLSQPIFNQGQNKARLKTAQAQQQQALYNFQQSILTAGQEVSNALYSYQNALEKQKYRNSQVIALEKSVEYTKELLRYSSATNYTDVLTSEQSLLAAELNGVSDRLQELQSIVNLYKALGGGWK